MEISHENWKLKLWGYTGKALGSVSGSIAPGAKELQQSPQGQILFQGVFLNTITSQVPCTASELTTARHHRMILWDSGV